LAFLYQRASTAEQLAEDRFQDVRSIANFVVFDLHDEVSRLDGSTQAREALIVRSVQYLEGLERTASSSPELLLDLAEGYKRLADVVGNPQDSNLGDRNRSNDFLNRAKAALETYPEELRGQPRALRTFIGVEAARAARIGFTDNDYGQATQLALQTQDASNLLLQSDDRALEDQKVDAYLDTLLGYLFLQQENVDDSVSAMRQALEKYQSLADAHPERADLRYELGRTHTLLGESMAWQAYYEGQHYLDALEQMAIGIDFLRELNETETTEPGTRKELINSMLKYAASGCVQEGQRIQTLSYLDKTEVLLSSFALANPNDQWAKDNFATVIGYRLLCLQGLSRIDDAYQVAKRFEDVQRSDLARNPNEPEQLRWYADGMSLVRGAYAQLGYGEQACEIAREIETAWRKRDALSVEDTTEYSLTKRQENDTVLSTCT
jgi:tetratricopeptide (TPR) repeat protein